MTDVSRDLRHGRAGALKAAALLAVVALYLGAWLMLSQWPSMTPVETVTFGTPDDMEATSAVAGGGNVHLAALGMTLAITAVIAQVGIAVEAARLWRGSER